MAPNGQKWVQMPQCLHRAGSKIGLLFPARSAVALVAGMERLYIKDSIGEWGGDV
jgi:hypothetical protein